MEDRRPAAARAIRGENNPARSRLPDQDPTRTPATPRFICVRCKKRITAGTGYLRDDGRPAHVRCPGRPKGAPDSQFDVLRCPSCGKHTWESGYLVIDSQPWHLGCAPATGNGGRKAMNGADGQVVPRF
jgi:DNA-directed RNA polymerase subunit RPC12/RpoP